MGTSSGTRDAACSSRSSTGSRRSAAGSHFAVQRTGPLGPRLLAPRCPFLGGEVGYRLQLGWRHVVRLVPANLRDAVPADGAWLDIRHRVAPFSVGRDLGLIESIKPSIRRRVIARMA